MTKCCYFANVFSSASYSFSNAHQYRGHSANVGESSKLTEFQWDSFIRLEFNNDGGSNSAFTLCVEDPFWAIPLDVYKGLSLDIVRLCGVSSIKDSIQI